VLEGEEEREFVWDAEAGLAGFIDGLILAKSAKAAKKTRGAGKEGRSIL
jgi:hypothetical protein